jgi:hypothetical protein
VRETVVLMGPRGRGRPPLSPAVRLLVGDVRVACYPCYHAFVIRTVGDPGTETSSTDATPGPRGGVAKGALASYPPQA